MQQVHFAITGMSCGHCVAAVSRALEQVPGVSVLGVSVGSATIGVDPAAGAPGAIVEAARAAVQEVGYGVEVVALSAAPYVPLTLRRVPRAASAVLAAA